MTLLLALLSGAGYGVLHGLGPDHCAALATLSARPGQAAWVGLRFGASHALALSCLALLASALGVAIPEPLERALEAFGGALLFLLGLLAWKSSAAELAQGGTVPERAGSARLAREATSGRYAAYWGTLFAASGVRSLSLVISPMLLASEDLPSALLFVAAFGGGVCLGMVAFARMLALAWGALPETAHARRAQLRRGVALLSMALATFWVCMSLRVLPVV